MTRCAVSGNAVITIGFFAMARWLVRGNTSATTHAILAPVGAHGVRPARVPPVVSHGVRPSVMVAAVTTAVAPA